MRAVRKTRPAPGFELVDDAPERPLDGAEVRVEVEAASVCGSDRAFVDYDSAARGFKLALPVTLGHEVAGTVVEVGDGDGAGAGAGSVKVGDRVALESHLACGRCYFCRSASAHACSEMRLLGVHVDGGFAERTVVPTSACFVLPDEVTFEVGALLESAGVAVHAVQRSAQRLTAQHVLVAGAGPIGLVVARLALLAGAAEVVVVEPGVSRAAAAVALGATVLSPSDDVVGRCRELAGDKGGFDVAFDCSGARGVFRTMLESLRTEGTAVSVGLGRAPVEVDTAHDLIRRGLTITGSYGRSLWSTWGELTTLVASGRLDLVPLITHRFGLSQFDEALGVLDTEATKVVLLPQLV